MLNNGAVRFPRNHRITAVVEPFQGSGFGAHGYPAFHTGLLMLNSIQSSFLKGYEISDVDVDNGC